MATLSTDERRALGTLEKTLRSQMRGSYSDTVCTEEELDGPDDVRAVIGHDEETVYEDAELYQWNCKRCGAEGWEDL